MKALPNKLLIIILFTNLNGCAFVDRTMLKPSAEMSRVPPLFSTKECEKYIPVDNSKFFDFYNPFVKNECEAQIYSIKEAELNKNDSKCYDENTQSLSECSAYLIRTSDNICNIHLSGIFGNRAVTNVSLGILATGAGIAGGLVSGLAAANALSGTSGFLTGTRSLMNEEIYRNYVAEAIIKEILANRKASKDKINNELASSDGQSGKIIGIEQIKQRVSEYHAECSFYSGLSSLIGKAGEQPKDYFTSDLKKGLENQINHLKEDRDDPKNSKDIDKYQQKIDLLRTILTGFNS